MIHSNPWSARLDCCQDKPEPCEFHDGFKYGFYSAIDLLRKNEHFAKKAEEQHMKTLKNDGDQ